MLSAVCLLDMKGFELFHWKFQDDFLWEILRAFVSYDWTPVIIGCTCQVRYIWSLCGTEDLINRLILDGLLWLCWRFFEAYILVGTMLFVCWFVVLLFPLGYLPQFINVTSLLLSGFFIIWLHFSFLRSFWHIEMLALPSLYFQDVTFSYSNRICYVFWLRFSGCFGLSKKVGSVEQVCTYLSIHLPSSWVLHCEIVWLPFTTVYGPWNVV